MTMMTTPTTVDNGERRHTMLLLVQRRGRQTQKGPETVNEVES
jgi:hypothetical protein